MAAFGVLVTSSARERDGHGDKTSRHRSRRCGAAASGAVDQLLQTGGARRCDFIK
jgi:hypothetical protein